MDELKQLRRWLPLLRAERVAVLLCIATLAGEALIAVSIPLYAGELAQSLVVGGGVVEVVLALLVVMMVVQASLSISGNYLLSAVGENVLSGLRKQIYDALQSQPLGAQANRPRGDLLSLLTHDAEAVTNVLSHVPLIVLPVVLVFGGAVVMLVRLDPVLGTAAVAIVPLFILTLRISSRRLRPLAGAVAALEAENTALAENDLRLLMTTKAFTAEPMVTGRFHDQRRRLRATAKRLAFVTACLDPVVRTAGALLLLAVLWLASGRLLHEPLTVGALVTFFLYGLLLIRPLGTLASMSGELHRGLAAAARIERVLEVEPEVSGDYLPRRRRVRGRIELDRVGFSYRPGVPVLREVSLNVRPGEVVGMTGANGTGKTTLAHLLLGLYRPAVGFIALDGIDLRDWNLEALRRSISIVPQRIGFHPWTVRENLTAGAVGAVDNDRLWWALETARAGQVVDALPDGLETRLGEGHAQLSAGQEQRLALARALYREAPVLILDEPTAMLDHAAERGFIGAARAAFEGRTVVLITHRPELLALADRVVHLQGGRLRASDGDGNVVPGPWLRRER